MARPLPVFSSLIGSTVTTDGPQHVRVFEGERFLYASFDFGREQILDVRAHNRMDLLQYWFEWMKPAPVAPPRDIAPPVERHERTPERAAQPLDEPPGEFLTSLGTAPRRRMTLEEFLVA